MDTEKQKRFLIRFAYFAVLFLCAFVLLRFALPPLAPFAAAFVIAYLLRRPIRFLQRTLYLPGKLSAILAVLLFYGIVGVLLAFLGIRALSGLAALVKNLPTIYATHMQPFFTEILLNVEAAFLRLDPSLVTALDELGGQFIQSTSQMVSNLSVKAMSAVSGAASSLPGLFIKLVVLVISTFFIAMDYGRLTGFCLRQFNDRAKAVALQVKEYVAGTLLVCIRSYFLIMSITFAELSIGLSLIRIKHAVLVAACISVFDILPVLGTGGIMIPWTVLTVVQGNYPRALGLLIIYLVITVIRNIIEPKIVGSQLGLHPVVTLASMFAGVQFFGVIGLFGFPIGLSLLRYLNNHGVIKLFK